MTRQHGRSQVRHVSSVSIRLGLALALLIGLLALRPARPARADLTPGHLDTGFDPGTGADGPVYALVLQPDGKVLIGGNFTTVNGTWRGHIARLNADGVLDSGFGTGTGADGPVRAVAVQPDGKVLIGGNFTTVNGVARNRIARLNADGTLDTGFDPGTGVSGGGVYAMALQPDGKVLIGGNFTTVNGVTRYCIARLNTDGSVDTSFAPSPGTNGAVHAVALQSDGKVLIGGAFTQVNGVARNYIARLEVDGSLDTLFFAGAGGWVRAMAIRFDDKILIGGEFTTVNGTARNYIAQLNADGSLNSGFDPGTGANDYVYAVALRSDGKVLIGGLFTTVNGVGRARVARLNANGSVDTSFNPGTGANNEVDAVAFQPDGQVLIGGNFTTVNGVGRNRIARLNTDGTPDTGFGASAGADGPVYAVALQPDGKILIGGTFNMVNGVERNYIARLNADGSLDTSFAPSPGPNGTVYTMALQSDSKVLIGGDFTTVNGMSRVRIARLNADGSLDTSFLDVQADGVVYAVALQPDGKVLIGGAFTQVGFLDDRHHIARLKANGSTDASFNPGTGTDWTVDVVAVQPDGKVLIGGGFTTVNGVGRNHIARLNADGSVDASFDTSTGANHWVTAITLQTDGRVLIGGYFTTVNGVTRNRIARLSDATGGLDTSFNPPYGADGSVEDVVVQSDGKVLIGGNFTTVNGVARNRIARLNADGTLDTGFDPGTGANDVVWTVALQPDNKVLIGGQFTTVNGMARNRIARLNAATAPAFTSGAPAAGTVGKLYTHAFTASGFPRPTFHVTSGSLPPGLTLNAVSGLLAGTPTAAGTYHFTVTASNYVAPSSVQVVTLVITTKVYLPLIRRNY